ncbi:RNA polymerase sigma-70 factor [Bacteroidaceae bacterium]|jgi:RNA polymerase sigma-70 factor (ECF subfamily)
MTEKELIIQLKEGNKTAFTILYKMYLAKVYNFSRLYLSSATEVEEVVQEVFVKLWEVRSFLREDDSFKGFLFIITRNLIFNQFRRSFNENAYKLTVLSSTMTHYDIEEELSAADLQEFIQKIVLELPPRQQEVFNMSRKEHLSYKEIAIRLNISPKTVERHINEAMKFLRKNILLYLVFCF